MTKLQNGTSQNLYSYNGAGTISAIQHNGFQYDFNYDVFGKLISTKIGNTALSSNTYSASGLLTRTTYANGDYIDYSYDDYDRVVQMEDENDVFARFVYNKKGLVTKYIDDLSGITTYYYYDFSGSKTGEYRQTEGGDLSYYLSYDSSGNTVEKTAVGNAVRTITSGTDSDGNAFVSNDGVTVTSEKDDFGRISSVTTANVNNSVVLTSEYTYKNGAENHSTTNIMNGIHQTLGNTDLAYYHYEYDANNNITGIYEQNTLDLSYTYDSLNQLTSETNYKNSTATQYEYDSNGNITLKKNYVISGNSSYLVSTDTYVYVPDAVANANSHFNSAWNDQLFSYNGTEIIYDDLGNPLHYRDGMEFEWTRGRLLDTVTVNNTEIQMYYDSNGLRTQKGDIYYYYDSESKLIALKKNALTMFFYYDSAGNPIAFSYNGCMHYYVKNLQGDIVRVVNEAGNTVASYEYDAWGKLLAAKNYYGVPVTDPNSIALVNPLRYRGYVYDDETGLYYLKSRYYDPTTCRFINSDSFCDTSSGTPLSTNMYSYCEDNPIKNIDTNGHYCIRSFNCYAYAMGYDSAWMYPGKGIRDIPCIQVVGCRIVCNPSDSMPMYYSVVQVKNWILSDFSNCYSRGRKVVRELCCRNAAISGDEYRIAFRVNYYLYPITYYGGICPIAFKWLTGDFHFMKQDPRTGMWWQKRGFLDIECLGRINPDNQHFWYNGALWGDYYNSNTLYLAVRKDFWSE